VPTVFVADDSVPVLRALRRFFAGNARFRIVGEARSYDETLHQVMELKPDVVLADLRMPGAHTDEEGLAKLVAACECPVIVMSFSADAETRFLVTRVGASRLVDKTKLYENLIPAIEEVLAERWA
jgi:DNA-binding NarL/FixJ family response regulator